MRTTTNIEDAQEAIAAGEIVQTFIAGRNMNVNGLSIADNGDIIANYSHHSWQDSRVTTLDEGTIYEVYATGEQPRRR